MKILRGIAIILVGFIFMIPLFFGSKFFYTSISLTIVGTMYIIYGYSIIYKIYKNRPKKIAIDPYGEEIWD